MELVARIVEFETALAAVQEQQNIIPAGVAQALSKVDLEAIDPHEVQRAEERDGIPVTGVVSELKRLLPADLGEWIHYGVTSQDAIDTSVAMMCRARVERSQPIATQFIEGLWKLSDVHIETPIAARTRQRAAAPTTLGLVAAGWASAVATGWNALVAAAERASEVQLGGSSGAAGAFADPIALAEELARRLDLNANLVSWQTLRERSVRLAGEALYLNAALGKVANDLLFMNIDEVGEIRLPGGGSSTLPHKVNPVALERVLASQVLVQNDFNALATSLHGTNQRDGRSWPLEKTLLPGTLDRVALNLNAMSICIRDLKIDSDAMWRNLTRDGYVLFAERARHMMTRLTTPAEAAAIVKDALSKDRTAGTFLTHLEAHSRVAALGFDVMTVLDLTDLYDNARALAARLRAQR